MKALILLLLALLTGCAAPQSHATTFLTPAPTSLQNLKTTLSKDTVAFDLSLPANTRPAPLVIVAHGFLRSKTNMAGWGAMLADEGYVAAVPTLPTYADHARNGIAIRELATWLSTASPHAARINAQQIGFMGFSAGGLSTLLAAADSPDCKIWIGLDPVDRDGMGLAALPRLSARPVILRADPSSWNADGNSRTLISALGTRCESQLVPGAIHIDAEWPTDTLAELACGKSSEQNRATFAMQALKALKATMPSRLR